MTDDTGDLFSFRPTPRESRADQIFRRFCAFALANPHIWKLFQQFTFELIDRGFNHYGAGAVFERIRWHVNTPTEGEDPLKLSNDFRAYYARLFHAAYPQHGDFFRNRHLRSEDRPGFQNDGSCVDMTPPGDESKLSGQLEELLKKMWTQ